MEEFIVLGYFLIGILHVLLAWALGVFKNESSEDAGGIAFMLFFVWPMIDIVIFVGTVPGIIGKLLTGNKR